VKIGVLTFHRCINYGSYWQARCLVEGLRTRGHDAVILDHDAPRINLAEWKCALHPVAASPRIPRDRAAYRSKIRRFLAACDALPLSKRFPLDDPNAMPGCDAVIVGSDEVWNLSHPWYGRCPLFYGEGVRAPRLLAYAASFGHHEAPQGLGQPWASRLRTFQAIAVRDASSQAIVERETGTAPEIVLDPCLQFRVDPGERVDELPRSPYVAVYGHGFSLEFAQGVARWARSRGLPLVSIGYRNDWADRQWIEAGPHEFARFIEGAEAVATNFFHGCVFSLRARRPFACEASWYRANKLRDLMAVVDARQHLLDASTATDAAYDALLGAAQDAAIELRIEGLRQQSARFLDRALAPQAALA
jgi:polysaccharide pyruvyl transferase